MRKAFTSNAPAQQLDALQQLVTKHISDPAYKNLVGSDDFSMTSTERGLQRWEQAHLVAALDVLNAYQIGRKSRSACHIGSLRLARTKDFKSDARTRMCELLKRWLRTHAGNTLVSEDELRGICGLCRDMLNHPKLFPARNPRSFLQSVAEVYDHLQRQLKEVLERDRTCAELAQRVLSLSRNLISDAIGFLLLAPTEFRQSDALPSLEVVALWQTLPDLGHVLPNRVDPALQKTMRDVWDTQCGSILAAVLGTPWCVRLFDGARAEEEATRAIEDRPAAGRIEDRPSLKSVDSLQVSKSKSMRGIEDRAAAGKNQGSSSSNRGVGLLISEAASQFERGNFKNSGLAGAFRDAKDPAQARVRQSYFDAAQLVFDMVYLLAEVLVQFHRISDGLGDYGMIRMSPWLHPFLDALLEKVQRLKTNLDQINEAVEGAYVLARARQGRVEKPAPSDRMTARAHSCIERAVTGRSSHAKALSQAIEELKARSAPERLPTVCGSLGDACKTLQVILQSSEFRASIGDAFAELPPLGDMEGASARGAPPPHVDLKQLADGSASDGEDGEAPAVTIQWCGRAEELPVSTERRRHSAPEFPAGDRAAAASKIVALPREQSEHSTTDSSRAGEASLLGSSGDALLVEVYYVTQSRLGTGLKRRDRRRLALQDGRLHIFEMCLSDEVEAIMDPSVNMDECKYDQDRILSLGAQRLPAGASWEDGVFEHANYTFEFDSVEIAAEFYSHLEDAARC